MSPFMLALVPAAALLLYGILFAIAWRHGIKREAEFWFAAYLASMIIWSLGALMMYADRQHAVAWNKVMLAGLIVMPLTFYGFVRGLLMLGQQRWWLPLGLLSCLFLLVLNAQGLMASNVHVTDEGLVEFAFGPGNLLFVVYFSVFLGLAVVALAKALRNTRDYASRNRIKYVMVGFVIIVMGGLSNLSSTTGAFPLDIAANAINASLLAYVIFRYQLLDMSIVVRRGMAYSLTTALIAVGYLLIIFFGTDLLHLSGTSQLFFVLLVAIIVAIALQPIRDRAQSMVDRLFFRERYDAGEMLQRLSRTVASVLDLQQLAGMILDEITTTMHVTKVSLLLKAKENGDYLTIADRGFGGLTPLRLLSDNPIADWLTVHDEVLLMRDLGLQPRFKGLWAQERADLEAAAIELFIGLAVRGELAGILVLGPKRSETPYNPDELRTLQTLANQVAVAVQNAWLYQSALQEKERAQTILRAAPAGIVVADRELRIVAMNPSAEAITGRPLAALQGRPLAEFLGRDLVGEGQPLTAALDAESSLPPTEVSLNGGEQRCDLLLKVTPLRDGFLVSFVDITRLKEVDRLKSEIVANVSHELRGPLANIKGYTELLLEGVDGDDRALRQRFLSVIIEETDRLAAFINDMLDLTRLESGHIELVLAPAPVDMLVAEVARSLELQARAAGVTIQVAVPAGLPRVMVDRKLMHSAVKNLLSNAIKFSPRGATVEVAARADGGTVALEVVDHGPGISAEDLSNLFSKFHRGKAAREAGVAGTGLGLVLVRQTVEQHHGAVAVDTAPGRGSRFSVTLPATKAEEDG